MRLRAALLGLRPSHLSLSLSASPGEAFATSNFGADTVEPEIVFPFDSTWRYASLSVFLAPKEAKPRPQTS